MVYMTYRDHVTAYPSPANLSYAWNMGFLALVCLAVQLVTGIFLAMHYVPNTDMAFYSVEHILRDVWGGWLIRYGHANGASFFFAVVYLHIVRGLYSGSYMAPRTAVWMMGMILFLLMMGTAFIGYVLPWGQMSLWGATVITNLASAIPVVGNNVVAWLWGGYSVANATLVRFYSAHYLLPFVIVGVSVVHIIGLHGAAKGSSNPIGLVSGADNVALAPYFVVKDLVGLLGLAIVMTGIVCFSSELLGHSDNSIEANAMVTPLHIVPEWYFLPFYAILRSVPHKLLGVVSMVLAIVVLAMVPLLHGSMVRTIRCLPLLRLGMVSFIAAVIILGWIGGMPVEDPYVMIGQLASLYYFGFLLVILPIMGVLELELVALMTK